MRVSERESGDVAELTRQSKALQRDRYCAVLLALEGKEAIEIAQALGRSRRSVQDWVYWYRDDGIDIFLPGKSTGRPTTLPREREAQLLARLDAGPQPQDGVCTLGGRGVVAILEREFGVKYSLDGLITCWSGWAKPIRCDSALSKSGRRSFSNPPTGGR